MAIQLYDATVAGFIQTVGAVEGILDKGLAHCKANNIDPNELVESKLIADMFPFRFQVVSVVHHSINAIRGAQKGEFGPPSETRALDYQGLQGIISDALKELKEIKPADVNALEGKDVTFKIRDFKLPFTAEGFLLSFSLPNLHFHATTTYDMLRMRGTTLGKRDYMGALRLKA